MNGLDFSQSIVGGAYTLSLVLRLRPPLHVIITHLYVACMFVCVYANNCHMLIDSRLSRCRCAVCRVNYSRLIWHTRHHCAPVSSTPCRRRQRRSASSSSFVQSRSITIIVNRRGPRNAHALIMHSTYYVLFVYYVSAIT